jgi:RNA polymerase sigma-70 factor (ECF subfamily)
LASRGNVIDVSDLAQSIHDARPRVVAALAVHCRNLDMAEEAFAESAARCLAQEVAPDNVAAWLITASKRWIVDSIRRQRTETRAIEDAQRTADMSAEVLPFPEAIHDERLRLIFICCHPSIATEARVALALKVICGLPVAEIARVFLTSEATMFQRITRAKRKVADAGIPFELPPRKAWDERLEAVLLTLELGYTVAYQDAAAERSQIDGANAGDEVARLASLVAQLMPHEPEVLGLAALIYLARSRLPARLDGDGAMIPLSEQDPGLWDFEAIEQARKWLEEAAVLGQTGPYQIMASIQLTHARRGFGTPTDWRSILRLYDALLQLRPGPIVALNRAVALSKVEGAEKGLFALKALDASQLAKSRPFCVAHADILTQLGRLDEAETAYAKALELDPPRAERLFLERKRASLWSN